MLLNSLEKRAIELIRNKFSIHTEIAQSETGVTLTVYSKFNNETVYEHVQDLDPLIAIIRSQILRELQQK